MSSAQAQSTWNPGSGGGMGANPQPAPQPQPFATSSNSNQGGGNSNSGSNNNSKQSNSDIPMFDPGSDVMAWNGQHWNVNNNRIFRARLEKFLNAPEQSQEEYAAYQGYIKQIIELMSPQNASSANMDKAWALLHKASDYSIDANLCDGLAAAIQAVWQTQNQQDRLDASASALEEQRKQLEWNANATLSDAGSFQFARNKEQLEAVKEERQRLALPYVQRLAEVNAQMTLNKAKGELSGAVARVQMQSLLVQLFMQRRFQHVIIGDLFYRQLFPDGEGKLQLSKDAESLFSQGSGLPSGMSPTVSTLDTLAREAIRDVKEGVQAFTFLLEKKELASASERLAEVFAEGEYMPEVRNISRDQKRQTLTFVQKQNELLSAIDVKDFTRAEALTNDLTAMAADFDSSKPMAVIQTSKTVAGMHLAKAKAAAAGGDRATVEAELKEATEIWPRNPDLASVSKRIFDGADVQLQALSDLDRLLSQHNYRQIFDDRGKYIAVTALYPDKQPQLQKVLEEVQTIEMAIVRSTEVEKRGDYVGAWEGVEKTAEQYKTDPKLNQFRAQLTTEAADFVRTVRTAQDLEKKGQIGSSLAWYLKAQKLYPPSEFAQDGIARLSHKILPESANGGDAAAVDSGAPSS
ncbi:hypothetical protein [Verrucomicrobium sp. GAS474]|uniref:hypothetical protein n=1 Tax=Verrucomicrobium sp. GAS474 TaxID=1882831 RepID=UPI000B86F59A|nr:hypothetical protein [Verrucomicrobium sp. GAS474]